MFVPLEVAGSEREYDDGYLIKTFLKELTHGSPLHVLAVSNAPLDVIQMVYQHDSKALTKELLHDAVVCGAKIEVIRFLKEKLRPEGCNTNEFKNFFSTAIFSLMTEQINEERIKRLVEVFPEFLTHPSPRALSPLHYCLMIETPYSNGLTDFMVAYLPDKMEEFTLVNFHDGEHRLGGYPYFAEATSKIICPKALGAIMSKVKTFRSQHGEMPGNSYVALLSSLFQKSCTVTSLILDCIDIDNDALGSIHGMIQQKTSRVSHVSLNFRYAQYGVLRILLEHMDRLESLELHFLSSKLMDSSYCKKVAEFLKRGSLRRLTISWRKQTYNAEGRLNLAMSNLLDIKTLQAFRILGYFESPDQRYLYTVNGGTYTVEVLGTYTVKVFKKDVALETMEIDHELEYVRESEWETQIEYNATLNRCGRGVAIRAANTKAFLDALASVQHDEDVIQNKWGTASQATVLYSLLHESPGIWSKLGGSSSSSIQGTRSSVGRHNNKRKAKQDPE